MQKLIVITIALLSYMGFSQQDKEQRLAEKQSNNYVHEGNTLVSDDFVAAEMAYREALSKQTTNVAGAYNLGNAYYNKGNYEEALFRHLETVKLATTKAEKHKAYHNIGNILMRKEKCKEAVEAYKNALRNNPSDDETRYNFAIAKSCTKSQEKEDEDKEDKKKIKPSEYVKEMKRRADEALAFNDFKKAYRLMQEAFKKDQTTQYYEDYIERLGVINGIIK